MFVPEYAITTNILNSIGSIEYNKAIVESAKILPVWAKQLEKEATIQIIKDSLDTMGINTTDQKLKTWYEGLDKGTPKEVENIIQTCSFIESTSRLKDLEEADIKYINALLSKDILPKIKQGTYRESKITGKTDPQEILAITVQFFDWLHSLEAKETHPIIVAALTYGYITQALPFESFNKTTAKIAALMVLKTRGYSFNNWISVNSVGDTASSENINDFDFTGLIDNFAESFLSEVNILTEKIKLLAKDTRVAKTTGRISLSDRQERIIEYLQDYGLIQNKDFATIFPGISEDSVLRDLKTLLSKNLIKKTGSTKSSRYELL